MKTSRVIIGVISLLILSACGSDSGSGGDYTGNKSDISAAKKLVNQYSHDVNFEGGYVNQQSVNEVLRFASEYSTYGQALKADPASFYAMRYVGCIAPDGELVPNTDSRYTQMDLIVGERSNRATYVQQHQLDRCYIGGINWNWGGNVWGAPVGNSGTISIGGIDKDTCVAYKIDNAVIRVNEEQLGYNNKDDRRNRGGDYNYYNNYNNNYWNATYGWRPDGDSYYNVNGNFSPGFSNQMGYNVSFNQNSLFGSAEQDSFAKIASDEAVFVTNAFRYRSSGNCNKSVYWGYRIDLNSQFLPIQILVRNERSNPKPL